MYVLGPNGEWIDDGYSEDVVEAPVQTDTEPVVGVTEPPSSNIEIPEINYGGNTGGSGSMPAPTVDDLLAQAGISAGVQLTDTGVMSQGYNPNASPSSGVDRGKTLEEIQGSSGDSFFSKLGTSFKDDLTKNPMAYLKIGLDGMASAGKNQASIEAARVAQQGKIDQQNNEAALAKQAKVDYTNSFNLSKKPINRKQAPLARTDGTPIYDLQGNIKGYK